MGEDKQADGTHSYVKRVQDYPEVPLSSYEIQKTRRTNDVVDELESGRQSWQSLKNKIRGMSVWIALAAATWTAIAQLRPALREVLLWIAGGKGA